jgi:hypothetical protein
VTGGELAGLLDSARAAAYERATVVTGADEIRARFRSCFGPGSRL